MKRGKDNYSTDTDEFERKARKSKKSKRPHAEDQYEGQHLVRPHHFNVDEDEIDFGDWQEEKE
jgi:hypothetical protein